MRSDKDISVLIASHNMADYLRAALNSVVTQNNTSFEVIVIDDGSDDGTAAVVEELKAKTEFKNIYYYYVKHAGKAAAMNHGLVRARGRYISILDADDELTSGSLETRLRAAAGSELVVCGFEVFYKDKTVGRRRPPRAGTSPWWLWASFYLRYKTPFSLNGCLIQKGLIEKVGGFDETLKRSQDVDLVLRLLRAANRVQIVDYIAYRYRKYRRGLAERLPYRLSTARYRAKVIMKNYPWYSALLMVPYCLILDFGKFLYEIFANYSR